MWPTHSHNMNNQFIPTCAAPYRYAIILYMYIVYTYDNNNAYAGKHFIVHCAYINMRTYYIYKASHSTNLHIYTFFISYIHLRHIMGERNELILQNINLLELLLNEAAVAAAAAQNIARKTIKKSFWYRSRVRT